jgi:hypothetical protein
MSPETKLLRAWPKGGPTLLWEMETGTGYSSPAISQDRLVYFHRQGNQEKVECLHPETGEKYWDFSYSTRFEDRYGYNNGPRASPVIDGDRVYTYGAEGKLHCFKLQTGQVYWKRSSAESRCRLLWHGNHASDEGELIINAGAAGPPWRRFIRSAENGLGRERVGVLCVTGACHGASAVCSYSPAGKASLPPAGCSRSIPRTGPSTLCSRGVAAAMNR